MITRKSQRSVKVYLVTLAYMLYVTERGGNPGLQGIIRDALKAMCSVLCMSMAEAIALRARADRMRPATIEQYAWQVREHLLPIVRRAYQIPEVQGPEQAVT